MVLAVTLLVVPPWLAFQRRAAEFYLEVYLEFYRRSPLVSIAKSTYPHKACRFVYFRFVFILEIQYGTGHSELKVCNCWLRA